MKSLAD
jgi:putative transposase